MQKGKSKIRIAVLISGRGSNMEAIIKGCVNGDINGKVVLVISDNKSARGLKIAKSYGIKAIYINPGKYKTKLAGFAEVKYIAMLKLYRVDLVVLAGFMRIVKGRMLKAFRRRIINIHPSLLPKFPGLNVHRRVIEAGEKESGATIHFVDSGIDTGEIIKQVRVRVLKEDTPDTLAKRVLEQEHKLMVDVVGAISRGEIKIG